MRGLPWGDPVWLRWQIQHRIHGCIEVMVRKLQVVITVHLDGFRDAFRKAELAIADLLASISLGGGK